MTITLGSWADLLFRIFITIAIIQYGIYAISRIYYYYMDMKITSSMNPKYRNREL